MSFVGEPLIPGSCNIHIFGPLSVVALIGDVALRCFKKKFYKYECCGLSLSRLFISSPSSFPTFFLLPGNKMTIVEVESSLESSSRGGGGVRSGGG